MRRLSFASNPNRPFASNPNRPSTLIFWKFVMIESKSVMILGAMMTAAKPWMKFSNNIKRWISTASTHPFALSILRIHQTVHCKSCSRIPHPLKCLIQVSKLGKLKYKNENHSVQRCGVAAMVKWGGCNGEA